jgi:hypothetical protein
VSVATKNALGLALFCVAERPLGNFLRQPQPARVQPVEISCEEFSVRPPLLYLQECQLAEATEEAVVDHEAIELMSMNGEMADALIVPNILLVDRDAHQVRKYGGDAVVVVSFHPHDFDLALRIRKLADIREKVPVLFLEPAEVEIAEDIAEKDQALEAGISQKLQRLGCAADLGAKVQFRQDERVVTQLLHIIVICKDTLSSD